MCFTIFWKEKRLFWQYKQEVQRVEKLTFFQRGLTHCFGPKMAIFPLVFLGQCIQGKCVLAYSRTKKGFFGYNDKYFKKLKN